VMLRGVQRNPVTDELVHIDFFQISLTELLRANVPLTLVGGGSGRHSGGRHLVFPPETPMTNLLLSVLDKAGVPAESLGDSAGRLDIEPLAGV